MKVSDTISHANADLEAQGFALVITSVPVGAVDADNWPHIAYRVRLEYKGKSVLETDYRLGIGHVDPKAVVAFGPSLSGWSTEEKAMHNAWRNKPSADFRDKALQAAVAGKLARLQKVQPQLADVLHSLLVDGEAFFSAQTFEDWAADFGYDADSRKAEAIYRACDSIGRRLANGLPESALEAARNITRDL